jgi:hypothetical protein
MWNTNFKSGTGNETKLLNAAVKDGAWKADLSTKPDYDGKTPLEKIRNDEDAYPYAMQKVPELADIPSRRWRGDDVAITVGRGMELKDIPSGLSQAPFVFKDLVHGEAYSCSFNGGIVAILQHKNTMALEPVTGWAVLDHGRRTLITKCMAAVMGCFPRVVHVFPSASETLGVTTWCGLFLMSLFMIFQELIHVLTSESRAKSLFQELIHVLTSASMLRLICTAAAITVVVAVGWSTLTT